MMFSLIIQICLFQNKVDVIKQYRQCVMNRENVDNVKYVIESFLDLNVSKTTIVYRKNPEFWYES